MFIKFVSWSSQRVFNLKNLQPSPSELLIFQIWAAVCNYHNSTAAGIMWRCTEYEWIFWCDIDCRYSLLQSDMQDKFSGRSLSILGYFTTFSFHQNSNSHVCYFKMWTFWLKQPFVQCCAPIERLQEWRYMEQWVVGYLGIEALGFREQSWG